MKLIINGDDFGLTNGCTKGIIKAMKEGILTDTTFMINIDNTEQTLKIMKQEEISKVGLHLNLTCGKPVLPASEVPSLVDENGNFYRRVKYLLPKVNIEEAKKELEAQVQKFMNTGLKMTHMDSHHHLHRYDKFTDLIVDLAAKYNMPLRCINEDIKNKIIKLGLKTTDYFCVDFYGENSNMDKLKEIIKEHKNGSLEIMCHPAIVDDELKKISTYSVQRQNELEILTSQDMKQFIKDNNIQLIDYDKL